MYRRKQQPRDGARGFTQRIILHSVAVMEMMTMEAAAAATEVEAETRTIAVVRRIAIVWPIAVIPLVIVGPVKTVAAPHPMPVPATVGGFSMPLPSPTLALSSPARPPTGAACALIAKALNRVPAAAARMTYLSIRTAHLDFELRSSTPLHWKRQQLRSLHRDLIKFAETSGHPAAAPAKKMTRTHAVVLADRPQREQRFGAMRSSGLRAATGPATPLNVCLAKRDRDSN
jgi:hypothetical protein